MTLVAKSRYTLLKRGIRPNNLFSNDYIIKYVRRIESRFLNEKQVFERQDLQLVSEYSGKKEAYTKLIFFHLQKNELN